MYIFSRTFIKKIQIFPWHHVTMPKLLLSWKKHKQGIQLLFFLFFTIRPSNTFNFWSVFGFNEYLWGILSLMNVESFWFHVWVVAARLLILQNKWPQVTFWPMSKNKKLEFKDHQIDFKMLRKILKKEV